MFFWERPERFIFSKERRLDKDVLTVDRPSGQLSTHINTALCTLASTMVPEEIFGLFGFIRLLAGTYVIVITKRALVGSVVGSPVYRVTQTRILNCAPDLMALSDAQRADETEYLALLEDALNNPKHLFYFSESYDLTSSLQRSAAESTAEPKPDTRFFWNRFLQGPLLDQPLLKPWSLPIIQGSVITHEGEFGGARVELSLLSRRSHARFGPRYHSRGIDSTGNVSNFVETEQIVHLKDSMEVYSFVQIRGSIPLVWGQHINMKYTPKMVVSDKLNDSVVSLKRHFDDLVERHSHVVAVSLINQRGTEDRVGSVFTQLVKDLASQHVTYIPYDFHSGAGKISLNFSSSTMAALNSQLESHLQNHGYFVCPGSSRTARKQQKGVVRTNCIDCLDRTNLVQKDVATTVLQAQLREAGVLKAQQTLADFPSEQKAFNCMWADNGDNLSMTYAGTPALKGEVTRTGKRSLGGLVNDGVHSLTRYYLNNFKDGRRQDGFDLAIGRFIPDKAVPSPLTESTAKRLLKAALLLILVVGMLMAASSFLSDSLGTSARFIYTLFWMLFSLGVFTLVVRHGHHFTNRPRLSKPTTSASAVLPFPAPPSSSTSSPSSPSAAGSKPGKHDR